MTSAQKLYSALAQARCGGREWPAPDSKFALEVVGVLERELALLTKERKKAAILPDAEQVYELFPKKVGREDALRAITKALKTNSLEYLLDKTNQFRECVESWPTSYRYFQDGGDRCPHPASFFNSGRYADDPKEWKRHGARGGGPQKVTVKAPIGWVEWLNNNMPNDDHPAHGQLLAALNLQNFATLPASWQTKCIVELTGDKLGDEVHRIEDEQRLRLA